MFPGLGTATTTDAIWFAANSIVAIEMPDDLTHPQNIRQWHREQQATAALPSDAPQVATETTTRFASQRDAEKFIKTDQRAETGGEGSETADRMRKAGQKFSDWVQEMFPGIDTKNDVGAAVWYVSEFPPLVEKDIPVGMSSPRHIREWFNEQQAPDMAHRFAPSLQLSIDRMRSTLRDSVAAMEASGISKGLTSVFT